MFTFIFMTKCLRVPRLHDYANISKSLYLVFKSTLEGAGGLKCVESLRDLRPRSPEHSFVLKFLGLQVKKKHTECFILVKPLSTFSCNTAFYVIAVTGKRLSEFLSLFSFIPL